MARRKYKHGRVGVKERLSNPAKPITLEEAKAAGYRRGYAQGHVDGVRSAAADILRTVVGQKLSASNIRNFLKDYANRVGAE